MRNKSQRGNSAHFLALRKRLDLMGYVDLPLGLDTAPLAQQMLYPLSDLSISVHLHFQLAFSLFTSVPCGFSILLQHVDLSLRFDPAKQTNKTKQNKTLCDLLSTYELNNK